jgi:hypothetical protein
MLILLNTSLILILEKIYYLSLSLSTCLLDTSQFTCVNLKVVNYITDKIQIILVIFRVLSISFHPD